jgi:chemotaxis signal transduction protein
MLIDCFNVSLGADFTLAIPLARTAEVLSFQPSELCPIPGICPELMGVNNQRGALLWVLDLQTLLLGAVSRPLQYPTGETMKAVVLVQEELRVAAVVSKLQGLAEVDLDQLKPVSQPALLGQILADGQLLHLLDVEAVFERLQNPQPDRAPALSV